MSAASPVARRRHRPGHHEQPVHPVRSRWPCPWPATSWSIGRSRRGPAGSSTMPTRSSSASGPASAGRWRDAGADAGFAGRRRDQQPARDHRGLVALDRATDRQRDRLAGHADRRRLRAARGRRRRRHRSVPRDDRSADLDLFVGTQARLDPRRRAAGSTRPASDARPPNAGDLLFGTIDTWLIWHLTGGPDGGVHVTDVTNASRTMLMNLERARLGPGAPRRRSTSRPAMLPEIRSSSEVYGIGVGELAGVPDRGRPRRPACRPVRSGLLRAWPDEMHVRNRRVPADAHGRAAGSVAPRADHDGRGPDRRGAGDLRPGGFRGRHRVADRLVAGQPRDHRRCRARSRRSPVPCPTAATSSSCRRSRGCSRRTGERRSGRDRRADRVRDPRPHRAGRDRGHRLPGRTTCARRWPRTSARHSPGSCGWTAG